MTKFIVVVGGVISGVGKGVATASIGRIMQDYGFSVTAIKIDPYINCDAGTMRPTEHGEVWVTDDGGETDQDLGTYERFLGISIPKSNNITTGQVYKEVIEKERRGTYLGHTVQFIPHITDEIKNRILTASNGFDIALVEIGGTVGDYENTAFLFALRALENTIGKDNICYILVTYLPIPSHIEEMKTKPTQLSVKLLRENGIQPDLILCRGKQALDDIRKNKIEQYANVKSDYIISMPDVTGRDTVNTTYIIPISLQEEGIGDKINNLLHLSPKKTSKLEEWKQAVHNIINPKDEVNIAMIGKYFDIGTFKLADSYISVNEALKHACSKHSLRLNLHWIDSKQLEQKNFNIKESFKDIDGVVIPGGFGGSGVEGKINAIRFCRENNIPFLGLCYGLQLAVIEFSRNVCSLTTANTSEIDPETLYPVIDILPEQKAIESKGGTMRLGAYLALLKEDSRVFKLYGIDKVYERHRHRYEVNPDFHEILQKHGMIFSGMSPDGKLVEFIELPDHKFFIATQSHPEFKSSLLKPAALFDGFIKACKE
ncbi:TPA: CTP synthase (glutamine hydrolyzing) [Candidatus Woesearchaeota archaeon]|nr:CTP synthase (glutamine hydrolyzing) [Candidatus Woesearchaeota archaeon]HIH31151.1 CTP synthase (glutamine hydrolyzing) [Candidatus Woesearchaeota archaeon]HIH54632.1 CTP synthase (glutamine hydrolyzing) [Candidatus Woesearchaeota archaeon]HIJ02315.1 CTP synthase (glutamine hydrolyzing) [Candidatus Woesearchaeota archaeon]HIJ14208.1 CTP synthase (glutamine hydrolyzing) [Candidatus Woesearchaeota archaeon]